MAGRRGKRWLVWLGAPLLLVALLVAFWSWDWFIPLAEARASAAIGRPVKIAHLHVKLGRVVTVTAEGVRVGNPPDFPDDPPFAEVARATARLDVGAFLRSREVVLPSIELDRPVVNVIGKDGGGRNYAFEFTPPAGETNAPEEAPAPRIGGLRINGGKARVSIAWLRAEFEADVRTEDRDGQEPVLVAEARGTYAGQRIEAQFTGGSVLDLRDESEPWPVDLRLRNGETTLALKGTVREPLKLRGADLRVELAGQDMASLVPLTGVPFPKTPPFRLEGKLGLRRGPRAAARRERAGRAQRHRRQPHRFHRRRAAGRHRRPALAQRRPRRPRRPHRQRAGAHEHAGADAAAARRRGPRGGEPEAAARPRRSTCRA